MAGRQPSSRPHGRRGREALRLGRQELDTDLYAGRWSQASPRAKEYMREMAALGDDPVSSGAVASTFGGHRPSSPIRDRLIEDGLVYSPARGQVAFTVPGFADYIRRLEAGVRTEPASRPDVNRLH